MRLFLIENYESEEFTDWDTDDMVGLIKKDSGKFIDEFLSKGHYVYRGTDELHPNHAYVIPTREYRLAHGRTFSNANIAKSFDEYLSDHGHGSRYRYSISTTTSRPEEYSGVFVDAWYYLIPKGNYQYHYHRGVKHDLNTQKAGNPVSNMKLMTGAITRFQNDYENLYHQDSLEVDDESELLLVIDRSDIDKLSNDLAELNHLFQNLFQDNNARKIEKLIDANIDKLKSIHNAFRSSKNHYMQLLSYYTGNIAKELKSIYFEFGGIDNVVREFLKTVVSNETGESMMENEVVFTCKEYYLIPYSDTGKAFMKRLTG